MKILRIFTRRYRRFFVVFLLDAPLFFFPNFSFGFLIIKVKQIEKRDAVLTSDQQINRLLRPGSTYFNLNPFEVLQLEPDVTVQDIKKKYRSLSILCHPDKNQDNKEQGKFDWHKVKYIWENSKEKESVCVRL